MTIDLTQDRALMKKLYMPGTAAFEAATVPELLYAAIDGVGGANHAAMGATIRSLLQAIQPIRREARKRMGKNFVDAPVELLYWANDPTQLADGVRDNWNWRAMIVLPAWTTQGLFDQAVQEVGLQLGPLPDSLRMISFAEGPCVQLRHVGDAERIGPLLNQLYRTVLPERGLEPNGPYHEIYLDDWQRTAPEKRTLILRQPVRPMTQ
jgi:hypothetical protein